MGVSLIEKLPMVYCDECLDMNAEPWQEFILYARKVNGKVSKVFDDVMIYVKDKYITSQEAIRIIFPALQNEGQ